MSRRCAFVGWLAAAALVSSARANAQEGAVKPTPIVLRPAAAPVPALKYQLLPDHRTPAPGNAAIFYHRAIEMSLEQQSREQRARSRTEANSIPDWVQGPLSAIPREPAKRLLEASRNALHEVELGARRPTCDWGFEQREQPVELLIGEIQQMRALIRLVSLRARLAVLDGHLDDAVHWIQTGFAMARHTSLGPVLIQSLIGVSMSQVMCIPLEDLIQAPGAPSLYWALAHRNRPLIDFSASLEGERFLLEREIPSLRELDGPAWSVEKAREFSTELQRKLSRHADVADGSESSGLRSWTHRLGMAAVILQVYPEAKRGLIAQGRTVEQVEAMPAVQVASLYTFQQYEQFRDDVLKWTCLPYYQAYKGMDDALAGDRVRTSGNMLLKLFTVLTSGGGRAGSLRHCRNGNWTRSSASKRSGCTPPCTASFLPGSTRSPKHPSPWTWRPGSRSSTRSTAIGRL